MKNTYLQFSNRIDEIKSFLEDSESINSLIDRIPDVNLENADKEFKDNLLELQNRKIDRKLQTYVNAIILLYGLFEQYIEDVLMAYIRDINSIVKSYNDLPEQIKKNHTTLSAQLLVNRENDKYRDRCNESEIIQHLQQCLDNGPYILNSLAFIDHKSNFRVEKLNHFFDFIGISGILSKVKQTREFKKFYKNQDPEKNIDNISEKYVFSDLDDLVWRRNVIAHGWPDEFLSTKIMMEKLSFIRQIGKSIYLILERNRTDILIESQFIKLPKSIAVFKKNIVCFHLNSGEFYKDDLIIAQQPSGDYLHGQILSIGINNKSYKKKIIKKELDLGFKIDFEPKKSYTYYIQKKLDM